MAADSLCIHDLDRASCADCTPRGRAIPVGRPTSMRTTARFDGECVGCGEPITPGDEIRYSPSDGGWIGECCT